MADASLRIKTLTATAVGVLVPLAVERPRPDLLWVAAALVLGLAVLDAYYLALERGLRGKCEALPSLASQEPLEWERLFTIDLPAHPSSPREVLASLATPATAIFYLLLVGLLLLGWTLT